MTRRKLSGFSLFCVALGFALLLPSAPAQPPQDAPPLKVGMAKTFFNDLPPVIIGLVTEPFPALMKACTGLDGKLLYDDDAFETAKKLDANEMQVGVFHGHEFAWIQKKYPKFMPLMVVANKHHDLKAFVIVHKESKAKSIADLRGLKVDMPACTKEPCRLFVEKYCGDNDGRDLKKFFGQIVNSTAGTIEALNDVCRKDVDAVIVDTVELEKYKEVRGPAVFANNLRVLQQSESFPSAVIVIKQGVLTEKTLQQFRDGMQNAGADPQGRKMFDMWGIEGFETIPDNFNKMLADVLKAYPAPEPTKVGMR